MSIEKEIYNALTKYFKDKLNSPPEDGIPVSLIKEIRTFLSEQHIGANPATNKDLKGITAKLPFDDEEELPLKRVK